MLNSFHGGPTTVDFFACVIFCLTRVNSILIGKNMEKKPLHEHGGMHLYRHETMWFLKCVRGRMRFKAILFDLDGTLLDTLADLANSMNTVLANNGFPVFPVRRYRYFVGEGMENLVRKTLPAEHRDTEHVDRCLAGMRDEYDRHWGDTTRPYDGIPEMLANLKKAGMTLAVLSNKPHMYTLQMIAHYFGDDIFTAVAGLRPDVPRKPDPRAALQIAHDFGVPPHDIAYVGDTAIDMETAVRAGMYPIGVLWGFRDADELLAHGAKTLLHSPHDLMRVIG